MLAIARNIEDITFPMGILSKHRSAAHWKQRGDGKAPLHEEGIDLIIDGCLFVITDIRLSANLTPGDSK